ncbi:DUF3383 domain-containing protein [Halorussus sp. MSC15.2]|uniref:DUF3383 domain-containing protein n=1 Tax=Halorussus sp. MSC15.2 TaxID=2283638 RepID=UPI0013D6F908|nr:DUF3383 domain-containing protein [Halorussus sp. MSC15.2]NEU59184.1 DUF3383 domain-containing protein [Halorussus sp. MSC15.2]
MPVSVVDINLSASTGATAKPTYNDIALIGHATTAPSVGFNNGKRYSNPDDVANNFGDGSDVHVASQALTEMGVESWVVAVAEELTESSVSLGGDTTSTDRVNIKDTNSNHLPLHDDLSATSVYVDGTEKTVVPKTESPPDVNETPANDEAFVNFDTGEIVTGTTTSGSGPGITADYHHLDWSSLETELEPLGIDLFTLADTRCKREHIGNLNELVTFASSIDAAVVGAHMNGAEAATDAEAMELAHEVAGYVPSGDLMMIAHKSSEDVASYVAGQLGVNPAWFDPFWDGEGYPFSTDFYRRTLVGDPGTTETFEGGDSDGNGPSNAIISVDGTLVLSNSLTTAGSSSDYQYLDVGRTESFIGSEVEEALKSLRLDNDQVPFTNNGRSQLLGAIRGRLQQYVGSNNAPLSELEVTAPTIDQLSDADKANRVFSGITVEGTLANNIHEFGVELNVRV